MAVATTPYTQNDYQNANTFRPYNLPVNAIGQAVAAQNQFWRDGAAKVKSKYEDALGLQLTSDANIAFKNQYLEDAEKQLTKLSTMNLADPSVQRQGLNLFKPLLQDKAIQYDNALTQKYGEILNTAQSYKNRKLAPDGRIGEGYNQDNLGYALDGFENFNSKTPRDEKYLKDLHDKLGQNEYTPYVDPSQEYLKLKDKCRAANTSVTGVNAGYIDTETSEGLSSARIAGCVKGGLSDAAWNQLGITGYMKLKGDPAYVAQNYKSSLQGDNKEYADQIIKLQNQMADYKSKGQLTPDIQSTYQSLIDSNNDLINKNDSRVKSFDAGDYSYISSNLKGITARLWANKDIGDFALANAWEKRSNELKADPLELMKMKSIEEQKNRDNDLVKAALGNEKLFGTELYKSLLLKIGINPGESITPEGLTTPISQDLGSTMDVTNQKVEEGKINVNKNIEGVYNEVKANLTDPVTQNAFENKVRKADGSLDYDALNEFVNQNPSLKSDPTLKGLRDKVYFSQTDQLSWIAKKNQIENELASNPDLVKAKQDKDAKIQDLINQLPDDKGIKFYNPTTKSLVGFSKDDIKSIVNGTNPNYIIRTNGSIGTKDGTELDDMNTQSIGEQFGGIWNMMKHVTGGGENSRDFPVNQLPQDKFYIPATDSPFRGIKETVAAFNDKAKNLVGQTMKSVIQDQSFNLSADPGSIREITNVAANYVPALKNEKEWQVRPASTRKGPNGETQVKIQVLKYNEKKKEFEPADNSDVFTESALSNNTINDPYSHLTKQGNDIWITTSNNLYKEKSPYFEALNNQVEAYKNTPLGNREQKDLPGRPVSDGTTIGVTLIGTGGSDKTYRLYIKDSNGKRVLSNYVGETSDLNTIANKQQELINNWETYKPKQ